MSAFRKQLDRDGLTMSERGSKRDKVLVPDGEFVFTEADFKKIAALVHGEAGIVLTEGKANLVYSRLAKRLRVIGLRTFREYCQLVESENGAGERQAMIGAMTTNVTRFFRESHHFDFIKAQVLPDLIAKAKKGGRVRIWSAACSSGEEPYSTALTLLDLFPEAPRQDVLILATDIDINMLTKGRTAVYPESALSSIPAAYHNKLEKQRHAEEFRIGEAARGLVRFNELNLLGSWPMRGKFDLIFCRNVMIYFDDATQNRIWAGFANIMQPRGVLCIGHSERIMTERQPFELVAQTTYRLKG
jgi:chemotaxis protein methyltransferase CheR